MAPGVVRAASCGCGTLGAAPAWRAAAFDDATFPLADTRTLHGFHAVTARLRQRPDSVQTLYVASGRVDARTRDLIARAELAQCPVHVADEARLREIAGTDRHQGVVAIVIGVGCARDARRCPRHARGAGAPARARRRHRSAQPGRLPAQCRRVRRARRHRAQGSRRRRQRDGRQGRERCRRHGPGDHRDQPRARRCGSCKERASGSSAPTPAARACSPPT